jgi:hypothetical protein
MTAHYLTQLAGKKFLHAVKKMHPRAKRDYKHMKNQHLCKIRADTHVNEFGSAKRIAATQHTLTIAEKASHRLKPRRAPAYISPALQRPE